MIHIKYLILTLMLIIICIANSYSETRWKLVYPLNEHITKIACQDSICIALATNLEASLLVSTNYGKTWSYFLDDIQSPNDYTYYYPIDLSFVDHNTIIIAYEEKGLRILDINKKRDDTINFSSSVVSICMYDSQFGVVRTKDNFYFTENGWKDKKILMTSPYPNIDPNIFKIWIHSKDSIDIYENWKTFGSLWYEKLIQYRTTNRGESWRMDTIEHAHAGDVYYVDRLNGWIAGGVIAGEELSDLIFKTTDGGDSWDRIYDYLNPPYLGLSKIAFKNINNGISIGRIGKILNTTDNGLNWSFSTISETYPAFNSVVKSLAYSEEYLLIGTSNEGIFRLEESTGIEESKKSGAIIYPNPARDLVFIRSAEIENYRIYDIYGNLRLSGIASDNRIKVNDLENGNYYITLGSETLKFQISR